MLRRRVPVVSVGVPGFQGPGGDHKSMRLCLRSLRGAFTKRSRSVCENHGLAGPTQGRHPCNCRRFRTVASSSHVKSVKGRRDMGSGDRHPRDYLRFWSLLSRGWSVESGQENGVERRGVECGELSGEWSLEDGD